MPVRTCLRPSSRIQYCSRYHRHVPSSHLSSHRIISTSSVSSQTFHLPFTIPFTSPHSPVHSALAGLAARPAAARHEKRDGTFSSPAGGQQNGRFNPFTRRRTDTARLTCVQPILHGGLEQGLSPGPIHHLIRRAVIAHVEIQTDLHERRRGPGLWPLTNPRQRLKVTLKIIDNAIYSNIRNAGGSGEPAATDDGWRHIDCPPFP